MSEQDIEKLVADHAALQNENAVLKEELAELQQQMAWLKKQMFGRKTEQTYAIMDGSTQLEAALLACVKLPVDRTFLIGLAVILEEILEEILADFFSCRAVALDAKVFGNKAEIIFKSVLTEYRLNEVCKLRYNIVLKDGSSVIGRQLSLSRMNGIFLYTLSLFYSAVVSLRVGSSLSPVMMTGTTCHREGIVPPRREVYIFCGVIRFTLHIGSGQNIFYMFDCEPFSPSRKNRYYGFC